jgi:hypothetical protein
MLVMYCCARKLKHQDFIREVNEIQSSDDWLFIWMIQMMSVISYEVLLNQLMQCQTILQMVLMCSGIQNLWLELYVTPKPVIILVECVMVETILVTLQAFPTMIVLVMGLAIRDEWAHKQGHMQMALSG